MPVRVIDATAPSQVSDANRQHALHQVCSLLSVGQVVTFWEGDIVDAKNHTFYLGKWEATPADDIRHWTKFPSFTDLEPEVAVDGGKSSDLSSYAYIRSELISVHIHEMERAIFRERGDRHWINHRWVLLPLLLLWRWFHGSINGFYYYSNSSPFQKLELKTTNEGRSGFSFSSYELQ